MGADTEPGKEDRCQELAKSSSFHHRIYSEVEEIGWENLVKLGDDLTFLSFRVMDKNGRVHILELTLEKTYPNCPPSVAADVPYIFNLVWSMDSKLKDVVLQFQRHLEKLQEFWLTLDDIDKTLWIAVPKHLHSSLSCRLINIGDDCCIMLSLNAKDPRELPECRFLGSDAKVHHLRKKWRINGKRCMLPIDRIKDETFTDNLAKILDMPLPKPPNKQKNDNQIECGVCYAQYLPIDDELGANSGSGTDYTCENSNCSRAFHSVCLGDWLCSITTTRQSFDILFGNCPYCSNPVAVRIAGGK
ncbi:hypothetical protein M9H77_30450 [Catharanthus roseus]|uniref:Uncharacterized protein n=1 Tax=Catharanthus roseus TaxID=4058 RepID=A0ACB9ZX90_CATRO|nr:hypothetical protein M9H77_30450 [Catharanthus roseus]